MKRYAFGVAVALGHAQALGTLVFAVVIAISSRHTQGWTMRGPSQPVSVSLVIEYLIFAVGIEAAAYGLHTRKSWARTPFLVVQLFAIVAVGVTLVQSGNVTYVLAGAGVIGISTLAGVSAALGTSR